MKFNTKAIHGNQHPEPITGAVMVPIFQTSTFVQSSPGVHSGYEYSRAANPTRTALAESLASIENGSNGVACGSGLAATDAVMKLLNPGDEITAMADLDGDSYRMVTRIYEKYGLKFHFVDMTNPENIKDKLNDKTKLIWIETPTNPLMKLADIQAISDMVRDRDLWVVVDNTFASPYLQNPLDLGADIVMHS